MTKKEHSYQDLKAALELILDKLQNVETDIDEAVQLYKEGQRILKQLDRYLEEVAGKVDLDLGKGIKAEA